MRRSLFERLRAGALALLLAGLAACAVAARADDEPIGSLELVKAEGVRVRSLYKQDFDGNSYQRYDAPQGSTFLVVRLDAKPTWGADPSGKECVSILKESVGVSGKGWSAPPIGMLAPAGYLMVTDTERRYSNELSPVSILHYDYAFAIPEHAKEATVTAGSMTNELRLTGKILPRIDWRDFMKVTIRRAYRLDAPQREDGDFDTTSSVEYRWAVAYAKPGEPLVAVDFVVEPLRGNGQFEPSSLEVEKTDFRLDYAGEQGVLPIGEISDVEGGFGPPRIFDVNGLYDSFERDEQGVLPSKEIVHVYRLHEPAEKLTLTYFGAPVGEVEIEPAE